MSKKLKRIGKTLLIILSSIIVLFIFAAIYNHVMLSLETTRIQPIGTPVNIDGHKMNIYTEGVKNSKSDDTIVLLSGSGVTAPIYDYKVLYSKLSTNYRVAVVEKFGYGYSDVSGFSRDVATMVEENRQALIAAGESTPYILMPHSMSALEAIYWAVTYPDEISAIVGLDMAVPDHYNERNNNLGSIMLMKVGTFFGFHRISLFNPVSELELSEDELKQHKLLSYRNSLNGDVYEECKLVLQNARLVQEMGVPNVPILMFTTNLAGGSGSEAWINAQDNFAAQSALIEQIKLDCGHNLHYYQSDYIAEQTIAFLKRIVRLP